MATTKKCTKCKEVKDLSEFNHSSKIKDGYDYHCRECKLSYYRTEWGTAVKIINNQKRLCNERKLPQPTYTTEELFEWMTEQENWEELYNNYVDGGYKKLDAPSCDRIDDYVSYTLDNIQLTTWRKNKEKGHLYRRIGINNKVSRAVYKISLKTGQIIERYHSMCAAARAVGSDHCGIRKCCKGTAISCGGFGWKYAND